MTGYMDTVFVFDGANSSDPDGTVVGYSWDLDDGITKSGVKVSHTFYSRGRFFINLTVTDNVGLKERAALEVVILNRRPVITSHTPPSLAISLDKNQTQTFAVVAGDPDGDAILHYWRVNGTLVGSDAFSHDFSNGTAGVYMLNITVSDGFLEDWLQWTVTVDGGGKPPPPDDNNTTPQGGFPVWIVGVIVVVAVVMALLVVVMKRRKPDEKKDEKPKPVKAKKAPAQDTGPAKPPVHSPSQPLPLPPPPPPEPPHMPPTTVVPPPPSDPPAQK